MKILSASQIRAADTYTIKHEPISSIDLMERASEAFVEKLVDLFPSAEKFILYCGQGNNGGDGLASARLLHDQGKDVSVVLIHLSDRTTPDFSVNLTRLEKISIHSVLKISSANELIEPETSTVVIDAILGTGLDRPVQGELAAIIQRINSFNNIKVALDIPSGLFADQNAGNIIENVIKADVTISFQVPKLCFFLPEMELYVGAWKIVNIGLDKNHIDSIPSAYQAYSIENAQQHLISRSPFAHKGNFGHALLVAGSLGKMGAAVLSSRACLRSGAGLLTCLIPRCGYDILQTAVPESMTVLSEFDDFVGGALTTNSYDVIGIGPGLGQQDETRDSIETLLENTSLPVVLDADGLNLLAQNSHWFNYLENRAILTPHPKEFDRIFGESKSTFDRIEKQIEASKAYNIVIVLKGHYSSVTDREGVVHFNTTGNPGMATAGAGDVLTGVILALMAQGYTRNIAASLGVFLHGLAGDFALKDSSVESLIASDINLSLPSAFRMIRATRV